MDYILSGTNVVWKRYNVIDTEFDSDHRLIVGKLWCKQQLNYKKYLHKRSKPPVNLLPTSPDTDTTPNELLKGLIELSKEERKRGHKTTV